MVLCSIQLILKYETDIFNFSEHLLNVLLKKHMSFIPLWSGLLNEPGRRYSNAYIESYFGVLKLEKEADCDLYED